MAEEPDAAEVSAGWHGIETDLAGCEGEKQHNSSHPDAKDDPHNRISIRVAAIADFGCMECCR